MHSLLFIFVCLGFFTYIATNPITYEDVRGTSYNVSYDYRAIKINGVRTMLIAGAIHYPRSTPGMWPYIMKMAKNQGLNTVQTYVFWNIHEQKQGVLDFSGRANLSQFLQAAADAGLFVNLRIGPYVCAEWDYGGLPAWLNQIANISFRSNNDPWKTEMLKFVMSIADYVTPYLAKNGGPIILAQIENEYGGDDLAYVDWCGSLVTNELAFMQIPWIMCNGRTAISTIETCNSCNCFDDGWMDQHVEHFPDKPMLFTENEGWFQSWGNAPAIRDPSDLGYSVAEWFSGGGAYHAYYMWHGGNNYGNTGGSGITTAYADDVCLHADGTANEPKYTHLSRLQHIVANSAQAILSQNATRGPLPWWDGTKWAIGSDQFMYSYPPSVHFLINRFYNSVNVLFRDKNITMAPFSVRIFDDNANQLWDSANVSDIPSHNTEFVPVVVGPLEWRTWSEPLVSNLPVLTSPNPIEQLTVTNDETIYLWYRRNVTLTESQSHAKVKIDTRMANAFLLFLDGKYLGEYDNHAHDQHSITITVSLDLSTFKPNQQYLFEILSITLGLDNGVWGNNVERKGIIGNVLFDGQSIINDPENPWQHQKGLVGEYFQIYTEQGSSKVDWNNQWINGTYKPITWFQANFDLDHLVNQDLNANPVLLDAQGLNRGHAFINGHDIGVYWLIEGVCHNEPPCCCQQSEFNCLQPSQRYYHIPSDWLMPKNNLITIFDDLGAPSPGSVGFVQRVVVS
jgi:beta-galactosidase